MSVKRVNKPVYLYNGKIIEKGEIEGLDYEKRV
jgi:hypothetical protein